jgi:hypothetical protein
MTTRNRPGAATVVAERKPRWFAIIVTALYGGVVLWPLTADRYRLGTGAIKWAMHVPGTAFTAVLAVVIVAVIWGWARAWRMGLHLHSQGATVRNYFRTYRFGWAEVTSFVDGSAIKKDYWALSLLAADGRAATASGTASLFKARPETLTAIRQAAECHGIGARLTGLPGDWRGPKWESHLLLTLAWILPLLFLVDVSLVVGGGEPCNGVCY